MKGATIGIILATAATIAYCISAWHLSGLWSTLINDPNLVAEFSIYTIKPLPLSFEFAMLHWQLLAMASLIFNVIWGLRLIKEAENSHMIALPLVCHLSWLVLATFLHIAGALASFIAVADQL